jgi:hypothetical protein
VKIRGSLVCDLVPGVAIQGWKIGLEMIATIQGGMKHELM